MRSSIVVVTVGLVACTTEYQQGLDDPNYGGPGALGGQTAPGGTLDNSAAATAPGGSGKTGCELAGGTLAPAPATPCTVSFSKDILTPMVAAGACSSASCHGTGSSTKPLVDPTDIPGTYLSMTTTRGLTVARFYVNPCSTDPQQSFIQYNMDPAAASTDRGTIMPQGSTTGIPTVLAAITTWVACGAPNN